MKALGKMKAGKDAGPSEVSVEMIAASGEIRIDVMLELHQSVLDGRGMLDGWAECCGTNFQGGYLSNTAT